MSENFTVSGLVATTPRHLVTQEGQVVVCCRSLWDYSDGGNVRRTFERFRRIFQAALSASFNNERFELVSKHMALPNTNLGRHKNLAPSK
jgi:hypothetical protein